MRTLVRWAARLYPAAWRARYGTEMEALLEDVGPDGRDLWDIVRSALFMQMTSLSFWTILAGCTLVGVLAAGIWSVALPKRYVSTAVIRVSAAAPAAGKGNTSRLPVGHLNAVQIATLSWGSLAPIIIAQNLYANERKRVPMEDVVEEMRNRHLRMVGMPFSAPGDMTFSVQFDNENPAAAQATVRAVVDALIKQNALESRRYGWGAANMAVLDPPSLPSQPVGPNRMRLIGRGLGAGLVLGLVCGAIFSMVRSKKQWSQRRIGGFAAAGMALGLTIAFLIPNEYVSTAVLRTADGDKLQSTMAQVLSDDSLAAIVRDQRLFERERSRSSMGEVARRMRNEHVHVRTGRLSPSGWAVYISFTYPDRGKAQGVTRDLVSRFIATTGAMPSDTGVLETANLPATPNYPNRLNITLLGTVVGILLGLAASRFRRPKLAAA
jgi:hypothetical protein